MLKSFKPFRSNGFLPPKTWVRNSLNNTIYKARRVNYSYERPFITRKCNYTGRIEMSFSNGYRWKSLNYKNRLYKGFKKF